MDNIITIRFMISFMVEFHSSRNIKLLLRASIVNLMIEFFSFNVSRSICYLLVCVCVFRMDNRNTVM